ncbi:MAG: hypothetical protein ACYDBB_21180 [Armatimonadota bacterium]
MRAWMWIVFVVILVLLPISAGAYQLRFKDAAGAMRTYRFEIKTTGTATSGTSTIPLDSTAVMTTVEKILNVKNGLSSISYEMRDGEMTGKFTPPGADKPQTVKMPLPAMSMSFERSPLGKVTNARMSGQMTGMMNSQLDVLNKYQNPGQGLEFPEKELKDGDTWGGAQTIPLDGDNKLEVTAKYTLIGTKVDNGRSLLQIDCDLAVKATNFTIKITQGDKDESMTISIDLTGKTTTFFDEAAGGIYSTTVKLANTTTTILGKEPTPLKMNTVIEGTMTRAR